MRTLFVAFLLLISQAPANAAELGRALILIFENGLPVSGKSISIAGSKHLSDGMGVIRLEIPAGEYELLPEGVASPIKFKVVSGEESEVTVHLMPPDKANADSKVAEIEATKTLDRSGPRLRLRLYDEVGKAISGATLLISGYESNFTSDERGDFRLNTKPGDYTFTIFHPSFETRILREQVSEDGSLSSLGATQAIVLKRAESELQEFVILAPKVRGSVSALVEVRRNSSGVADVLGSEQMARQGDSDAAASLRRVTGLTLVGGKYVYVRGLGERYSAVTLNGAGLPSPEPSRRVVPLDLFPSSVLESVVVQKSFAPELPAEFGGGLIQLRTKSLPEKSFLKASVSVGYEGTNEALGYAGGARDALGIDDGVRAMPSAIRAVLASGKKLDVNNPPALTNGLPENELIDLGKSLETRYDTRSVSSRSIPGMVLSAGHKWGGPLFTVGGSGSLLYGNNVGSEKRKSARYNAETKEKIVKSEEAETNKTEREVKTAGTADLGIEFGPNHQWKTSALIVRHTSDETEVKEFSRSGDSVAKQRKTTLEWVERQLFTMQTAGTHKIGSGTFTWRLSRSEATRDAPDTRDYTYLLRDEGWTFDTGTTGNMRTWSELRDRTQEIGSEFVQPFRLFGDWKAALGFSRQTRTRSSDTWRLQLRPRLAMNSVINLRDPSTDSLLRKDHIRPDDGFMLTNLTDTADSMGAKQETQALHAALEWEPTESWKLNAGMRRESGEQRVRTYYYYSPEKTESEAGLATRDLLPAYALTWKPAQLVRARLAYSETLARPEFRELSEVPFIDDESGYETVGNTKLRGTVIENYDHRWEFYPSPEESASVGVFFKRFLNPIEETFEPSDNLRKTFANAKEARNAGLEFETRVDLRRLHRELRRWSFIANLSLIRSRIVLGPEAIGQQTSSERPLQGQSPWVANLQLQYDRPTEKRSATLLYNAVGPRITEVGTNFRPDIYEQPFHQLDLVASQGLNKNFSLSLKLKNLLDPEARYTQGGNLVRAAKKGRSANASLSASF
jgi:outer membrane receptor protein involved in Fe transport